MCFSDKVHYLGCSHFIRKHRINLCPAQKSPNMFDCQLKERTTICSGKCFRCFLREMQDGMHGAGPPREKKDAQLKEAQPKPHGEQDGNAKISKTHGSLEDIFLMDSPAKPTNNIGTEIRNTAYGWSIERKAEMVV